MKYGIASIFLGCFLVLTFSKALTLFNFYINQDAIIEKYCENKNKPKLNCDGKCVLAKQIKAQEKQEAGNAYMEAAKIEVLSSKSFFLEDLMANYTVIRKNKLVYVNKLHPQLFSARLLKPPAA